MLHRHSAKQKRPRTLVCRREELQSPKLEEANLLPEQVHGLHLGTVKDTQSENGGSHFQANRYRIPQRGLPEATAYDLIHNELSLDGNPHLNLASFVNTETSDTARKLITENINKNLADNDEYPQLIELTQRCISMLAQLWHCDENKDDPLGCATTGSSEAIMLGGLAMKKRWEHRMRDAGKPTTNPNIIMSTASQVALEKFARYFDVECRLIPVSSKSRHCLDPQLLHDYVDENTIGAFVILGTTYTGHLESVERVADALDGIERAHPDWSNTEIPIHVDGASGGFIVPFTFSERQLASCGLKRWGFNHPRVVSVNASGHKFGLTTPGLGWVLWRNEDLLADELKFKINYLGGVEESFGLNFSRPGFQVIHQYYNFVSLGRPGYHAHFAKSMFVARAFCHELLASKGMPGFFEVVSSIHERIDAPPGRSPLPDSVTEYWEKPAEFRPGIPLAAFKLSRAFHDQYPEIPQSMVAALLRSRGWIIPNYPLPSSTDGSDRHEVLRVVFRSEMKLDLAQLLVLDLEHVIAKLIKSYKILLESLPADEHSEHKRDFVYKMLLKLASPTSGDEPPLELQPEHRKSLTRNYKSTC
ncbi:hypothetical protein HG537_0G00950 [Torulaspora globosa]|uniref:Glutamate decarboxylase n=1 Tax=Torulaspora globosa TaxID=48254 RepID=A0A7H9HWX2_9SACH|nr:hypothetical protein HG537_0G00950 [Torulaspora sp. CBS 2947]